jgi:hypothetical protein
MKADILEQLVEDWLQAKGYFTRASLRFKPSERHPEFDRQKDSVYGDVDVIGIHPIKTGSARVFAVSYKSWQDGFEIRGMVEDLSNKPDRKLGGKATWKHFRELVVPKWTEGFLQAMHDATGTAEFTYVTAVTLASDPANRSLWEENPVFKKALGGNPILFVTLEEMLVEVHDQLGTSVASSQFSRTLQLIKAAGLAFDFPTKRIDRLRRST